jgi:succinate dehydrogenase flavin-adding protein (antitoxin of CptAB toxin-antitoxin module)
LLLREFSKNSIKNLSKNDLSLFDEILDSDDQKLYDFFFKNQPIGNKDHESFINENLKNFTEQGNF